MENSRKPLLLITGINGYIGAWTTLKAVESGEYRVRGTVRNKDDVKKMAALKEALGDAYDEIEFVNADLTNKESLKKAAEGVDYVLHMASPYPAKAVKSEDDVVKPAVEGTVGILEALKGSKVKRVVVTSSCAAIMEFKDGSCEVDEESWPEITGSTDPYMKSKALAEKAAWDFIDGLSEGEKFELCTVNPGVVTGPLLNKGEGASQAIFTGLLKGEHSVTPKIYMPMVDVRDVADAHLKALKAKPFQRYAMNENTYLFAECGQMFYEEFGQYGYNCTRKSMSKCMAWFAKCFVKELRSFYPLWDIRCHVKHDRAEKELGIKFMPIRQSLIDMGYSLIKHGYVEDKTKGKKKE